MNINSLLSFYQVARLGSFAEAARHMNIPVSTVSRQIQQLEKNLNTKLMHRSTRSLQLTEQGGLIFEEVERLQGNVQKIQDIVMSQDQNPSGIIRITAPQGAVNWPLCDWIFEFKKRYPSIELELVVHNRFLDLQEEGISFAFRQGPLVDSSLIAYKLLDLSYGIFANSEVIEKYPITHPNDLQNVPTLGITVQGKHLPWLLQTPIDKEKLTLPIKAGLWLEDIDLVKKASEEGLGYSYLSTLKVAHTNLQGVLDEWWPPAVGFYLVYLSREYMPEKDRLFLEFIHEKCDFFRLKNS